MVQERNFGIVAVKKKFCNFAADEKKNILQDRAVGQLVWFIPKRSSVRIRLLLQIYKKMKKILFILAASLVGCTHKNPLNTIVSKDTTDLKKGEARYSYFINDTIPPGSIQFIASDTLYKIGDKIKL